MKVIETTNSIRVSLVAPPANFIKNLYGFKSDKNYRNQPPLGIGYIASSLLAAGFEVRIFDCEAHGWDHDKSVREILAYQPDVVGITAITFEAKAAFSLAKKIKEKADPYLVLGGAHANSFYEEIPSVCPFWDAICVGESEQTMVEICTRLSEKKELIGVKGCLYKLADGSFSELQERDPVPDIDTLPPPAYKLFPLHLYRPLPHRARRLPSGCMIASRGCSYGKCTYCEMSKVVRKHYRSHSPGRVVEDLKSLVALSGVRDVYFQDDIFINDPKWVEEFCDLLIRSNLGIIWSCESRFKGVSKDLLIKMKEAGCWRIYYGFESGSQRLLDKIKKGFTLEEARQAAKDANDAGLDVVGFFMLGLPGETPQDGENTIKFAKELGLDHAMFSLTLPHPGSELYDICLAEGQILKGDDYFFKKASYLPNAYKDVKQLEDLRARAFREFYLRPSYVWRCLRKMRSIEDMKYYLRGFFSLFNYLG